MTGERLGRLSLRIDAAYCAIVGFGVIATAPLLEDLLALSSMVLIVVGALTVVWSGGLCWLLVRVPLLVALRIVAAANILAAAALAVFSSLAATVPLSIALVALAIDIAIFAGSQLAALVRSSRTRSS